jgi:hypothetical protein
VKRQRALLWGAGAVALVVVARAMRAQPTAPAVSTGAPTPVYPVGTATPTPASPLAPSPTAPSSPVALPWLWREGPGPFEPRNDMGLVRVLVKTTLDDSALQSLGLSVTGRVGDIVSGSVLYSQISALAAAPGVSSVERAVRMQLSGGAW